MKQVSFYLAPLFLLFITYGCASTSYPEDMTKAERKAYYQNFNESKTDAEWAAIRAENQAAKAEQLERNNAQQKKNREDTANSIAFSVRNNSLFPKKLKIVDNILTFQPFETRYFGFAPTTKVYLIKGKKEEYLFTLSKNDQGKQFKLAE